jgi:hypothetical protein
MTECKPRLVRGGQRKEEQRRESRRIDALKHKGGICFSITLMVRSLAFM